jgi:hypothetical protein
MAKTAKMVQVDLTREGGAQLTTWVDVKPDLKKGAKITLKDMDPNIWWKVEKVYDVEMDKAEIEANRNWDNNNYDKHDGTALKDRK